MAGYSREFWVTGTVFPSGFAGGYRRVFLRVCSISYRMILMSQPYRWMEQLYKPIRRLPDLKKGITRRQGWFDEQDCGVNRRG